MEITMLLMLTSPDASAFEDDYTAANPHIDVTTFSVTFKGTLRLFTIDHSRL